MHSTLIARTAALALAVFVTVGLLGSVDYLATTEPAPTMMATTTQNQG